MLACAACVAWAALAATAPTCPSAVRVVNVAVSAGLAPDAALLELRIVVAAACAVAAVAR